MTPEFKAKWIKALRSGEYKQARGVLKDCNGGMCCLGVAADLLNPAGWASEAATEGKPGFGWGDDTATQCAFVASAIGLYLPDAKVLAARNDGNDEYKPHSFAEIADIVEELNCER